MINNHWLTRPLKPQWQKFGLSNYQRRKFHYAYWLLLSASPSCAEVVTDGSMGAAVKLTGPNFQVTQELGNRVGNNLFHSFQDFNLHSGESAVFTGDAQIAHVISRVTGGNPSKINGLLQSNIAQADFYFINPAGILFGAEASIQVPAAFYASTAETLRFSDGLLFDMHNSETSSLSIAAPEAFGFSQSQLANIRMDGSVLALQAQQKLSLSAGNISIDNAQAVWQSGQLNLIAVGANSIEVPLTPDSGHQLTQTQAAMLAKQGQLSLIDSGFNVSGDGAGSVFIQAGKLALQNSAIFNANLGSLDAISEGSAATKSSNKSTTLQAHHLSLNDSWIVNDNHGTGNSAPIDIQITEQMTLSEKSLLGSDTYSLGDASEIRINATNLRLDQSHIYSDTFEGQGQANQVILDIPQQLIVQNQSTITSNTYTPSDAAAVIIDAAQIQVLSGSKISSNTYAAGKAGDIQITAQEIRIDAQGSEYFTGIFTDAWDTASNHAGSIRLDAEQSIQVINGGSISSITYSQGNAGNIEIYAPQVQVAHNDAIIRTGIFSNAEENSTGHAGSIVMHVPDLLSISNIGAISTDTYGQGNGGNIYISAGDIYLSGLSEIYRTGISSDAGLKSTGNAGSIQIQASGGIQIYQGARISSSTFASGNAGQLNLSAENLLLDGNGYTLPSGIFSDALSDSQGHAGTIQLQINQDIQILANAFIASNTYAQGHAGEIEIAAANLFIDTQQQGNTAGIQTETRADAIGNAGNIDINIAGLIDIREDGRISSTSNTPGNAGDINVSAQKIHINAAGGQFFNISSAAFPDASGEVGNITLTAEQIILDQHTEINIAALGQQHNPDAGEQHFIAINSQHLELKNGSFISSLSYGNAAAGAIIINSSETLLLSDTASITTIALEDDGGPININSGLLYLNNSFISTSVRGKQGNGGDISLQTPALLMQSGFIQANTAAAGASGGDINIHTKQLITPANQPLYTNVQQRLGFVADSQINVIQAAAPEGVNGQINLSVPELDLSASILAIDNHLKQTAAVAKNPCKIASGSLPSSLIWSTQGGIPRAARDSLLLPIGKHLRKNPRTIDQNSHRSTYKPPYISNVKPQNALQPGC